MESKRNLSCIVCPMSCTLEVISENGKVNSVTGNTCQRGKKYAEEEIAAPKRMLTTTVRITGGTLPLVPVISKTALPKDMVVACAHSLSSVVVKAPVCEGDVICRDIMNLGVDIVATRDVRAVAE